jgi:hypothetical protein
MGISKDQLGQVLGGIADLGFEISKGVIREFREIK